MRKTSEVLNKAADLIEQYGWRGLSPSNRFGGSWGGIGKPMCLEGGILAALGVRTDKYGFYPNEAFPRSEFRACPSYRAVQQYLAYDVDHDIWTWNDRPGRTKEEVIEVLRACAVIEEAKEKAAEPQKVEVSA